LIGIVSSGVWKILYLSSFLEDEVRWVILFGSFDAEIVVAVDDSAMCLASCEPLRAHGQVGVKL